MKRRPLAYIALAFLCALVLFAALKYFSPYTPAGAVRLYAVRVSGLPGALAARVERTGFQDRELGEQFVVEGVADRETGQEIRFFYLKRDDQGRWRVTAAGTGP